MKQISIFDLIPEDLSDKYKYKYLGSSKAIKYLDYYICSNCKDWLFNTRFVHMAVCPNCGYELKW